MVSLSTDYVPFLEQNAGLAVEIQTADGVADAYVFVPQGQTDWPVIVFYMDGPGIRPALFCMARRLADQGFYVLLPNLFYRSGVYAPFDPETVFGNPTERDRLMKLIYSVNQASAMKDTSAFVSWLDQQAKANTKRIGAVGYCMGGSMALSAAGFFPEQIKASACIHGGRLATNQSDSPHLQAKNIACCVYIGVAGIDQGFSEAEKLLLENALLQENVNFELEVYPDVHHGFAVNDLPVYDQAASEHHWQKLQELFVSALQSS